ncbi:MFS transporter [Pseudonocardia sp. H11422]|uniref:MFS transporter n=1 Tax=Pseudonocardia sp. H11422 TaxID=2835866 RepID=UPI0020282707|nr:MFS transporter [Pseudonocardia sp. H11422]
MTLLDVSIVNVAVPSIERGLHASPQQVQWVVSGYALTFGLALVPAGRLGDMLGRRRMFLIALGAFVLTSALAGAAPTAGTLVAARLLQGVAAGTLAPQNSALIQDLFRGPERGRAFGVLGATIGLATAVGPVLGGLILTLGSGPDAWRWVFYVNVPIGVVALVLAARWVPRTGTEAARPHLDLVGTLLLGGGVVAVLLPLVEGASGGLSRWWWAYALSVLLFALFGRWEVRTVRRGSQPLLDPRLLHIPGYPGGLLIGLLYFAGFTGIWLVLAMYFQFGLGYSPLRSGLAVTPFALGAAISSMISGRLVPRLGRWLTVVGLIVVGIGIGATALVLRHVTGPSAGLACALPLFVAGLGGGMVVTPNITLALEAVPVEMAGAAGGALQTGQRIGAAMGTALLAGVYYSTLSRTGGDYSRAVSDALFCASGSMLLALVLAVAELVRRRHVQGSPPAPKPHPEFDLHRT